MNWVYYTETARFMAPYETLEHWTDGLKICAIICGRIKRSIKTRSTRQDRIPFPNISTTISARYDMVINMLDAEYDQEKWDFIVSFFATAFVAFIVRWSNNGMKEDPAEFIARIRGLFDGSVLSELESHGR